MSIVRNRFFRKLNLEERLIAINNMCSLVKPNQKEGLREHLEYLLVSNESPQIKHLCALQLLKLFQRKLHSGLTEYLTTAKDELERIQEENERLSQKSRTLQETIKTDNVIINDLLSCGSSDIDFFGD